MLNKRFVLLICVALFLVSFVSAGNMTRSFSSGSVEIGGEVVVSIGVDVFSGEGVYSIREKVPAGFNVTDAGDGTLINNLNEIRWFQLGEAQDTMKIYKVKAVTAGVQALSGTYSFDDDSSLTEIYGSKEVLINSPPGSTSTSSTSSTGSTGSSGGGSSFSVTPSELATSLEQGTTSLVSFVLKNTGSTTLTFGMSSDLSLIQIPTNLISLGPDESQTVFLNIVAEATTGVDLYVGHVQVSVAGIQKEILLSIEVVSPGELFDMLISFPERIYQPGEYLDTELSLESLFGTVRKDVTFNYIIKNEQGETVYSETITQPINEVESIVKQLTLPKGLLFGRYVLYVQMDYGGKIASASKWFTVGGTGFFIKTWRLIRLYSWRIIFFFSAMALLAFVIILYLQRKKEKESNSTFGFGGNNPIRNQLGS